MARVLGRYDRGLLAALQTDATMAMNLLGVGMHASVLYYASRRRRYQAPLVGIVLVHAALLTVASLGLVLAFGPTLAGWQDASYDQTLWLLAALLVPAGYLELCFVNFVQAQQDFRRSNILIMAGRTASLVGAVTLVWWLGYGVTGAVIGARDLARPDRRQPAAGAAGRGRVLAAARAREPSVRPAHPGGRSSAWPPDGSTCCCCRCWCRSRPSATTRSPRSSRSSCC